jgi:hypothetical protein
MTSYPSQHTSKTASAAPEKVVLAEFEHIERHLAARSRRTKVNYSLRPDFIPLALLLSEFGVNAWETLSILADWTRGTPEGSAVEFSLEAGGNGMRFFASLKVDESAPAVSWKAIETPYPYLHGEATLAGLTELTTAHERLAEKLTVGVTYSLLEAGGIRGRVRFNQFASELYYRGLYEDPVEEPPARPHALIVTPENRDLAIEVALTPYFDVTAIASRQMMQNARALPSADVVILSGWVPQNEHVAGFQKQISDKGGGKLVTVLPAWWAPPPKSWGSHGLYISRAMPIVQFQELVTRLAEDVRCEESRKPVMFRRERIDDLEEEIRQRAATLVSDFVRLKLELEKKRDRPEYSAAQRRTDRTRLTEHYPSVPNLAELLPRKNGRAWSEHTFQDWCRVHGKPKPLDILASAIVDKIKELVDDDYDQDKIVELLDVWTKQTMRKRFRKHTGMTIEQYRGSRGLRCA